MTLNIWKWNEGDVEDDSIVIAVCPNAQVAWEELRALGVPSEIATAGVRFMDRECYGLPIEGRNGETYRVADAGWIGEEFKRYAAGVRS